MKVSHKSFQKKRGPQNTRGYTKLTQHATKGEPSHEDRKSASSMKQTKRNILKHIHTRHIFESFPYEGGTSICIERKDKRSKAGEKPAQRRQTQIHTMKISKKKTKYKHMHEGE
jgi:hypothetical protein